jgi:hypothetical protein
MLRSVRAAPPREAHPGTQARREVPVGATSSVLRTARPAGVRLRRWVTVVRTASPAAPRTAPTIRGALLVASSRSHFADNVVRLRAGRRIAEMGALCRAEGPYANPVSFAYSSGHPTDVRDNPYRATWARATLERALDFVGFRFAVIWRVGVVPKSLLRPAWISRCPAPERCRAIVCHQIFAPTGPPSPTTISAIRFKVGQWNVRSIFCNQHGMRGTVFSLSGGALNRLCFHPRSP